jgi:hypothetical protein
MDDVADIKQHDMPVSDAMGGHGIVPVLLAALDVVVCRGELGQHAGSILVGGVLQVPALEYAHRRHAQVLHARVEPEPLIGALLVLVVVDMGVAGVPTLVAELRPALHYDVHGHGATRGDFDVDPSGRILGAPLDDDARPSA